MSYIDNYRRWLDSDKLSDGEKDELRSIAQDDKEIRERFTCGLSFGTAGLRGIMKPGMNAMNTHTVALATQGLADYIIGVGRADESVIVGYDCRINSKLFAETVASVLAANGIHVYIFDDMRPTPELSFALRELKCVAGVNITASHNPKEYNGYKAYWDDGAQLSPESAAAVSASIEKTDIFDDIKKISFSDAVSSGKITFIGDEIDQKYLAKVQEQAVNPDIVKEVADDLKIVYTPLHGTGYKMIPEIVKRIGFKHLYMVPEQAVPDGRFPSVVKPNPEYHDTFKLGIELADKIGSDLIFASDPDADRMGAAARDKNGKFVCISGNQMGALLLDYILTAYEKTGTMPPEPYSIKTIVSTEIITKICAAHNVKLYNVLTGFKFIGEVIKNHERMGHGSFVFGFEESYGYLKGTYCRDKDAVVASMLVCEMTAYYKTLGMTLIDALDSLYDRMGFSLEKTEELYITGLDGAARIAEIMESFRRETPSEFGGVAVAAVGDYKAGFFTDLATGEKTPTGLPSSNVMYFRLINDDIVIARPSGTEPKIKFYYLMTAESREDAPAQLEKYIASVEKYK